MRRWAWVLVWIIAIVTRVWGWMDNPPGFNQDEASIGYEAYALLYYGMDRHGYEWPIHLISWGSGQHILYAWLTIPFIAWFGLEEWVVRLPMLITGILSVPLFALVVRRLLPTDPVNASRVAAWSAWILAICPWHILMSRWALESNLLPFVWLCAIYCWIRWMERPSWRWSIGSAVGFAACLYAYSTAYVMVPLIIVVGLIRVVRTGTWSGFGVLRFLPLLAIGSAPVISMVLINRLDLPEFRSPWLSIPRLPATERYIEYSIFHQSDWLTAMWNNMQDTIAMIAWQSDAYVWNGLPVYAIGTFLSLPFLLWGLIRTTVDTWRDGSRAGHYAFLLLAWFAGILLVGILAEPNVNRLNLLFMPVIAFTSFGIVQFIHSSKRWVRWPSITLSAAMLLSTSLIFSHIIHEWPKQVGPEFHQGAGQAIRDAVIQSEQGAINGYPLPIVFERSVRFAQIYTLFYLQLPPEPYAQALQQARVPRVDFPTHYGERYWFEGTGPIRHAVSVSKTFDGYYGVHRMQ